MVYVSPLKALSNDIQRNLERRWRASRAELIAARVCHAPEIRAQVRTGDTPQTERARDAQARRRTSS